MKTFVSIAAAVATIAVGLSPAFADGPNSTADRAEMMAIINHEPVQTPYEGRQAVVVQPTAISANDQLFIALATSRNGK